MAVVGPWQMTAETRDATERGGRCDPPGPDTIGAEMHCLCWFDEELPCCWCGDDDDGAGSCTGTHLAAPAGPAGDKGR